MRVRHREGACRKQLGGLGLAFGLAFASPRRTVRAALTAMPHNISLARFAHSRQAPGARAPR